MNQVLGDRRGRNVPVSHQLYVKMPCGNMFDGDTERVVEEWYWSGTLLASWSLASGKPWALMPVSLVLGFAARSLSLKGILRDNKELRDSWEKRQAV